MDKVVQINYFAVFREQSGLTDEQWSTGAATVGQLYDELAARHKFTLSRRSLRAALNDEFCKWDDLLQSGDKVVFVPPVAGG